MIDFSTVNKTDQKGKKQGPWCVRFLHSGYETISDQKTFKKEFSWILICENDKIKPHVNVYKLGELMAIHHIRNIDKIFRSGIAFGEYIQL